MRRRPSAQRVRAARAWIGLERPAFAKRSGISTERLAYLENGKGDPRPTELDAIQRVTGVPMWFLVDGFDGSGVQHKDLDQGNVFGVQDRDGRVAAVLVPGVVAAISELDDRVASLEGPATSRPSAQVAQLLEQVSQAQQQRREESLQDPAEPDHPRLVEEGDVG